MRELRWSMRLVEQSWVISLATLAACGASCSENARNGRTASPLRGEAEAPGITAAEASAASRVEIPAGGNGGALQDRGTDEVRGLERARREDAAGAQGGESPSAAAPTDVGPSADPPLRDAGSAVVLTAVVVPVTPDGALGIAARWVNGSDRVIFLRGCATADGWYLQDGEWREHGAFGTCMVETNAVAVAPGATHVDLAGAGPPPNRGSNVWRLVARYGTGCRNGEILAASECSELHDIVSVNQVRWTP